MTRKVDDARAGANASGRSSTSSPEPRSRLPRRLVDPVLAVSRSFGDVQVDGLTLAPEVGEEVQESGAVRRRPDVMEVLPPPREAGDASWRQQRVPRLADQERPAGRRTGVASEDVGAAHARLPGDAQQEAVVAPVIVPRDGATGLEAELRDDDRTSRLDRLVAGRD